MKRYLIVCFVLAVLFVSGCQVQKTGGATATATPTPPTSVILQDQNNVMTLVVNKPDDMTYVIQAAGKPSGFCGNKVIEGRERCDGTNLDGQTCATVTNNKYPLGTLSCWSIADGVSTKLLCTFNTMNCYR